MPLKTISQRKFLKGIIATTPKWEQSPGAVPRASNLLLTDRGGWVTCYGSKIISLLNGALQTSTGPWTELFLFQPTNVSRYYIGIKKDLTKHLGAPTGLAAADGGAGGTLANANYKYEVTALDGAGGETTVSNEVTFANPGAHKVNLTWNVVTNAQAYNVYRTAAGGGAGTEVFLTKVSTNAFTDDGSITPGSAVPPTSDNTQQCVLYQIPATSYGDANIIKLLPADAIVAVDGTPGGDGGGGGSGGGGTSSGNAPNPSGGVLGNLSPIPQIIQYTNKAVLALGNGITPQLVTDNSPAAPTAANVTNTFTANYPNWVTATVFATGTIIMPTAGNAGNFIFKAIQGGTTGGGAPTWPQTANVTVADNNIIWQNQGVANTAPVPRGAAHAEVYAGSLWLANTSPTTTADNFDGPNCIKMSDLNNPNSWNPLNTAFVARDDSDQITGLKTFTIAAEGISPTGSLVVFKYFKTYQIVGVFGAADFAIQEAKTDMGCIASRSIQFLPGFGIVRLTHLGIAIFDGTNDRLISEEIRPYLFFQPNVASDIQALDQNFAYFSKGAQTANPPMYSLAIPTAVSANLPSTGGANGFSFSLVVDVASDWIQGNYFWKVFQTKSDGTFVAVSNEVVFGVFVAQRDVQFTPPSTVPAGVVGYRVFVGQSSGNYTKFADVSATAPTTFIGFADFPNSGTPSQGSGALTRLLCYDMVLKAWAVIDLPFSISVLKQVRAVGTNPLTISGGFSDGSVRRLQTSADTTFDGEAINWSLRSAEVFGKNANARIYYRRLTIRGTTTNSSLAFNSSVNLDGTDGAISPVATYIQGNSFGTFDFLSQIDIGFTNYVSHVTLSGSGNIEITAIDWEADSLREGVPPII